jgi:cysteinyl-tRNA synthetase
VEGEVSLYTCGPTVYDYAHIGNFRAYIFEDLLKRFLVFRGFKVKHVMNITDVDDKTIKGANAEKVKLQEFTQKYTDAFFEDIEKLYISKADYYPRATDHIPEMVEFIKGLLEMGYAYKKNGSVYFNISKFPNYGRLSKIDLKQLRPGKRIESDEYEKESANDFALWKDKKEGEPFWETEVGPGRPGWHIECSAMSSKYLGKTFDIHCGGVDNIFPHHENEIAQSEAFFGKSFVNYWLHCRHLIVDGEKMSKSKGNFYTLRDLLAKNVDPYALRFLLLSTHYRKMLNFTFEALEQASSSLKRINDFLYELKNRQFEEGENKDIARLVEETNKKFIAGKVYRKDGERLMSAILSLDSILAVLPAEEEEALPSKLMKKIEEREKARADQDYELADQIRKELLKQGVVLEDTKDGVRWKIVKSKP